jgi:hypothetical protein
MVRQADAHAWAEVWLEGEGWVRFDPVESINPLLVDQNTPLASRFPTQQASDNEGRSLLSGAGLLPSLVRSARLGWDTVNFQWNLHIVSYDRSSQQDFFQLLGIESRRSWKLVAIIGGGILFVLLAVFLSIRGRSARKDRWMILYGEFCRVLARRGLARRGNEGPRDFSSRAAARFPEAAEKIGEISEIFIGSRYGKSPLATGEIRRRVRELKRSLAKPKKATPAAP